MNPGPQPELLYSQGYGVNRLDLLTQQTTSGFQLPSGGTVAVFDYNYHSQVRHIFSKVIQNIGRFVVAYKSRNTRPVMYQHA